MEKGGVAAICASGSATTATATQLQTLLDLPKAKKSANRKPLTAKAKTALATEVVNATLKALSTAAKGKDVPSRALQPISDNVGHEGKVNLGATAECGSIAFGYLRSLEYSKKQDGTAAEWQVETGMLLFAGRCITLGLDTIASRELCAMKRRFAEAVAPQRKPSTASTRPEKETITSLLQLDFKIPDKSPALPLVITYHQHVLRLISAARKPRVFEAVLEHLSLEFENSPANIIRRHAAVTGDNAQASKQLEALAQTILSLCPSVHPSNDENATRLDSSPSPTSVFELQVLALSIRKISWKLSKVDPTTNLLLPFSRCLLAFGRRAKLRGVKQKDYEIAQKAYTQLVDNSLTHDDASFDILRSMSSLAESINQHKKALHWAERLAKSLEILDQLHARRVAATVHVHLLKLKTGGSSKDDDFLQSTLRSLKGQISGHAADYDYLLLVLASLMQFDGSHSQEVCALAASFAQRYTRSYQQRNQEHCVAIIIGALRRSEVERWVSVDSAHLLIRTGVLAEITAAAERKPPAKAWSISRAAAGLGRILKGLLLQSARESAPVLFDDKALDPLQRATVVEWQFVYAAELAYRQKYRKSMRKVVVDMLLLLDGLYQRHPVRRARVAATLLRLHASYAEVVAGDVVRHWRESAVSDELLDDQGLSDYVEDVNASLMFASAFCDALPDFEELKLALMTWEKLSEKQISDLDSLVSQLRALSACLAVKGDESLRLRVLRLISSLCKGDALALCELAGQHLDCGYAEKASEVLGQTKRSEDELVNAKVHLARALCHLESGHADSAEKSLQEAFQLLEGIRKEDRKTYDLLTVESWLVQSLLCRKMGKPYDALTAAKKSMQMINTLWAATERSEGQVIPQPPTKSTEEVEVDQLTTGVSKLQLTRKRSDQSEKGAAFWPLVPLLCRTLTQLSSMYSFHGIFGDADYYLRRVVDVCEALKASPLLQKALCHRARLLTIADDLEQAEVCLTKISELGGLTVDYHCAKAFARTKGVDSSEALKLYDEALKLIDEMVKPQVAARKKSKKAVKPAEPILFHEKRMTINLNKAIISLHQDQPVNLANLQTSTTFLERRAHYLQLMNQATTAISSDITFSMLPDSTLSIPSLPSKKPTQPALKTYLSTLLSAKNNLTTNREAFLPQLPTTEIHTVHSMLSQTTSLLSPLTPASAVTLALEIDLPKMHATQSTSSPYLPFPPQTLLLSLTPAEYQERIINTLPQSIYAVSLTLSHDSTELYAVRYTPHTDPFIIRLPFSRSDSPFDYTEGRRVLEEIISRSNATCHSQKGKARTWWAERERLDKRLGELVRDLENIWMGGFKGIFDPLRAVDGFRGGFEATLRRFLAGGKGRLHDDVLGLFLSLGEGDEEGILDLLYFVVDLFVLNGGRVAYDEIDFDGWGAEVLGLVKRQQAEDAAAEPSRDASPPEHLVLVLDKKLQTFPWENLPCLQGRSVSRVGSMLSLQRCVAALREVRKDGGTYILNPAGDLGNTEKVMLPHLKALHDWGALIREPPTEEGLVEALTRSEILLYFGHGSAAQFIRPRRVRRLEKCSRVVWLMGCSSGSTTLFGELEPLLVPEAYLTAGAQAVVATLWDVTDKDVDRFSVRLGGEWGLWEDGRKRTAGKGEMSLVEALAKSRDACYLRYLNGAAPVVYGVPVWLGD
ncbi:hypothetical protein K470DRAFT_292786 [Piedraia hortae CBS 480.64]|uniref:separase n=1 Tax=Piedraia hortae CBS 480.64 TaxID=1314780 RepID=A0A6A7C7T3_9PEZI|nr:hypothetical protein K470DRAFT_292786 [Piedraia hortae CBS 480.64]